MITALLLSVGFLAGVINSIAGGGALIAFPAMLYAGLSPLTATITSSVVVGPGLLSATLANKKELKKLPKKYLLLLIPWVVGGTIGMLVLDSTSHETFNNIVPWLLALTVVLFIFQPYMQKHIHRPAHLRPQYSTAAIWTGVFTVSLYAGYFAIGSGLMLLTLFGFSRIKTIHQIISLKNLAGFLLASIIGIFFALQGEIAWKEGLILAAGSVVGGYVGAKVAHEVPRRSVRLLVGLIGIVVAIAAFIKF